MSVLTPDFDHRRDRRSLRHRYAEVHGEVKEMALIALGNEQITRQRVEHLEAFRDRSFLGRLKWLFQGK